MLKRLAEKPPELKQEVIAKVTYWDTWPFFLIVRGADWDGVVFAEAVGVGVINRMEDRDSDQGLISCG